MKIKLTLSKKIDSGCDESDYRLSATSRAFHEKRSCGRDRTIGFIESDISFNSPYTHGELITNEFISLKAIFLDRDSFEASVDSMEAEFEALVEQLKVQKNKGIIDSIENMEFKNYKKKLLDKAYNTYLNSFTKNSPVVDKYGNVLSLLRVSKDTQDKIKLEDFEVAVKAKLGIKDDLALIYPPIGDENSPYEFWANYLQDGDIVNVGRFDFIKSKTLKRIDEIQNEKQKKFLMEAKNAYKKFLALIEGGYIVPFEPGVLADENIIAWYAVEPTLFAAEREGDEEAIKLKRKYQKIIKSGYIHRWLDEFTIHFNPNRSNLKIKKEWLGKDVGLFIGKGGANIKALGEKIGTYIKVI